MSNGEIKPPLGGSKSVDEIEKKVEGERAKQLPSCELAVNAACWL